MLQPKNVRLETSIRCQLACPTCERAEGKTKAVLGNGVLSLKDFEKFIDDNPYIRKVEISSWGEVFLNPDLLAIIKCAHEKNVKILISNGANFNTVKESVLEGLVKYQVARLAVALDGTDQKTYVQYRRGGNFDQVIQNVTRLNAYKAQYQSEFPKLVWQFIVFGHNEHQIPEAMEMAESLGMDFRIKMSWDETISPIRDPEYVRQFMNSETVTRSEYQEKYGENYFGKHFCRDLWKMPQLNWDGQVVGCCYNYWGSFGNAFEEGLSNVMNGEAMSYARQMVSGEVPARDDIPCTTCKYYKTMQETDSWIDPNHLGKIEKMVKP